jgi:hypothetical protein
MNTEVRTPGDAYRIWRGKIGSLCLIAGVVFAGCFPNAKTRALSNKVHKLGGYRHFNHVQLLARPITDEDVESLIDDLSEIEHLSLSLGRTKVTDRALVLLRPLSKTLYSLDLTATAVTDEGIKELGDFKLLGDLAIGFTRVDDRGLKCLVHVPLRMLTVGDQVTDKGIELLQSMQTLIDLTLPEDGPVTDEALRRFQKVMPRCRVYRGFNEVIKPSIDPFRQ